MNNLIEPFLDLDAKDPIDEIGSQWGKSHSWQWSGFKCHWRELGLDESPPLVFIHGFGGSSAHWRHNALGFVSSGYKVYSLDLLGFGLSDQPGDKVCKRLDNFLWAQQLIAFLEQVVQIREDNKAVLVCNSLGSLVALTAAVINPKQFKALVFAPLPDVNYINSFSFKKIKLLNRLKSKVVETFFNLLPLEAIVPLIARTSLIRFSLQAAYAKSIRKDSELHNIVSEPARRSTAARALRAMCIGMSLRENNFTGSYLIKRFSSSVKNIPVLMIWGCKDRLIPLTLGRKIAMDNPWIEWYEIRNTGHCPHDESPNEFNQCVLDWLDIK